jgi:hypothetical protein
MLPSLMLLGMIASLTTGGAHVETVAAATPETQLVATGKLVFPSVDGFTATARYTLSSLPRGATAVLKSQAGGAGLPRPYGSGAVVAAFTMTVSRPVQMPELPTWQITAPTQTLARELALEVCPGSYCKFWENSHADGDTISVTGVGYGGPTRTLSLSPGTVYVFELVLPPNPPILHGTPLPEAASSARP